MTGEAMSRADSWALMNDAWLQAERKREMEAKERTTITWHGGRSGGSYDETDGKRHAWVKPSPTGEPGRWLCWRMKPGGSLDLVTAFYRRKSAEKAARLYERDGTMKGFNF